MLVMAKTAVESSESDRYAASTSLKKNLKGLRRALNFLQKNIIVLCVLFCTVIIIVVAARILYLVESNETSIKIEATRKEVTADQNNQDTISVISTSTDSSNLSLSDDFTLITRSEWLAQPPQKTATPLQLPVPYVIIHHTATERCSSRSQCVFSTQLIQTYHMKSSGWWDIGYNFLIGGDGNVYEGRGWKGQGAHTYGYNDKSLGITFIGLFRGSRLPTKRQMKVCKQLIAKGVELGYIKKDYKLMAARQLSPNSQNPGEALYEDIKTWDHWTNRP
jgi:N-acetylmuramoyl-L-alanine amidase